MRVMRVQRRGVRVRRCTSYDDGNISRIDLVNWMFRVRFWMRHLRDVDWCVRAHMVMLYRLRFGRRCFGYVPNERQIDTSLERCSNLRYSMRCCTLRNNSWVEMLGYASVRKAPYNAH